MILRRSSIFLALALATLLGQPLAMAQTTSKDVSKTTAAEVKAVKSFTVEKKKEAMAYGRNLMSDADADIKRLERAAAKGSKETKAQFTQELKKVKASRKAAAEKLDAMGKAPSAGWSGAKNSFADAYKELRVGFERTLKGPRSDRKEKKAKTGA
jgi:signal transduction protein with GAF and PtsI domain